ncbi:hypothetical protein ACFTAO_20245 [Paenibacillus rhizoplanae]
MLSWLNEHTGLAIQQSVPAAGKSGYDPAQEESDSSVVWLAAELNHEEQAGWLNGLMVQQGMTLYQVIRQTERLEDWFMDAVAGLSHRGRRNENHTGNDLEGNAA